MNSNLDLRFGAHEKYLELCALFPTGTLTREEQVLLQDHVESCQECREMLRSSANHTFENMAHLAAALEPIRQPDAEAFLRELDGTKEQLIATIQAKETAGKQSRAVFGGTEVPVAARSRIGTTRRVTAYLAAAAVLLLGISVAYEYGFKRGDARSQDVAAILSQDVAQRQQLSNLQAERTALSVELSSRSEAIGSLMLRANQQEKDLIQLKNLRDTFEEKAQQFAVQNQRQADGLAALSAERDQLARKLQDSEKFAKAVQDDLSVQREQRQKALLRSTNLEAQIDQLSAQLHDKDATINQQQQFLASDRDIREMMGARKLYIADVFDVDGGGQTRQPFGRVFYTKAQSLVFYAFDLDQMPGYRQARAFQGWGRQGQDGAQPMNLGVFYMDNATNRRWVLKSDDPTVLAQIDAVFVTVEPKGGSRKPSSKPFLYAYLHTAPVNHP